MDNASKILSDVVSFRTYAKFLPHANRRETFQETVNRCMNMHLDKFPHLSKDIIKAFEKVHGYEIMPAMRSLQFSGDAIRRNNLRAFNCFVRDTSFITKEGVKSFSDFNDGDTLTVLTHLGNWKQAVVKNYGKQKVVPITIKRGKSKEIIIKATENHRWILDSGRDVTAIREGDYLLGAPTIFDFNFENALDEEKLYWCYGYVFGDGTLAKNKAKVYDRSMVRLCGDQIKFENRFLHCGFKSSTSLSLKGDIIVFTGKYLKTIPDPSVDSPNLIKAFVRGYLDADGAKTVSQTCLSEFRSIQATGQTHIEAIKKLFPIAGVYFTGYEEDKTDQVTNFGPRTDTTFRFGISTNVRNTSNAKFTVVSIARDKAEETDVWCLEVEDDASFVLSCGISTGNCSYAPVDNVRAFGEVLFLLLSGCGVGFSVQKQHIKELPFVKMPKEEGLYTVHDSIEGWAQALDQLVEAYFYKRIRPIYDFNSIRQKGAYLSTTGAKAPGPEPLKHMLNMVEFKLKKAIGRQLTPIEVHDIICIVSDAVISGGIRRSSLISLFDRNDEDMLKCKSGEWWTASPWRARANNSVVLPRGEVTKEEFDYIFGITQASGSGEPGFMWTNDANNWGTNPCGEVSLENNNLCNLTTINQTTVTSKKDFLSRIYSATLIGTIQASYTDFPYVRDRWRRVCEEKALLGVSFTGIGDREGTSSIPQEWLEEGARYALEVNEKYAKKLGINKAARLGTVKPEGTSSLVCSTSSGVHARHAPYYLRRVRMPSNDSLALYLKYKIPELMEEDKFSPNTSILVVPQKSPESSIYRDQETALTLFDRTIKYNKYWVRNTHREGDNYNNVSVTISVKEEEWFDLKEKMWEEREFYTGISLLPFDGGTYVQAPFEECTEQVYTERVSSLHEIDLKEVREDFDMTDRMTIQACAGGACEIT